MENSLTEEDKTILSGAQPLQDMALVKVKSRFEDTIKFNGQELFLDARFQKEGRSTKTGYLIRKPKKVVDFEDVLVEGNRIYFHYNALEGGRELIPGELYLIEYSTIHAAVQGGNIRPVHRHLLCEPYHDPSYKMEVIDGKEMMIKENDTGLVTSVSNDHHSKIARVYDSAIKGLNTGDLILYQEDCDFENVIEGKTFFVMHELDIAAKVTDVKEIL